MKDDKYLFITNSTGYSHKRVCDPFIDYAKEKIELLQYSPKSNPFIILKNIFHLWSFILRKGLKIKKVIVIGDLFYLGIFIKKKAAYIFDFNILKDTSRKRSFVTKIAYKIKCVYPLYFYKEFYFFNALIENEYKEIFKDVQNKNLIYLPVPIHPSFYPIIKSSDILRVEKKKKIDNKQLVVICFGHTENKNLEITLSICEQLSKKYEICINVINDKYNISEKFKNSNINRYTNLNDNQIVELYMMSNILFFPSSYEGFGMPIIEAAISQCIVVTSDISPMNKLIGSSVLIKPIKDSSFNISLIEESIKNYEILTTNGFREAMGYHIEKMSKILLD